MINLIFKIFLIFILVIAIIGIIAWIWFGIYVLINMDETDNEWMMKL